jgi:electron transfer flavoprotein alpha/beta subunit
MAPRLAEVLGYASLTDAYALALEAGSIQATRRWGDGYAGLEAALPAVVSVAPEAFPPRYAHGARIMDAYRQWAVTTWDAGDLSLAEEALQPCLRFRSETFPAPQEMGEKFRGEAGSVAQDAVTALRIQKLIGQ